MKTRTVAFWEVDDLGNVLATLEGGTRLCIQPEEAVNYNWRCKPILCRDVAEGSLCGGWREFWAVQAGGGLARVRQGYVVR